MSGNGNGPGVAPIWGIVFALMLIMFALLTGTEAGMSNLISASVQRRVVGSATRKSVLLYMADKVADNGSGTRSDGEVLGFTDHDRVLSFGGTDFEPESGFTASEIRGGADLAVDSQDAKRVLTSDRITETDIIDGRWDNALAEVCRVNWRATGQRVLLRRGSIGEMQRGRVALVAEMRSLAHVLGQTVGRAYQGTYDAALGDRRCGIDLDDPVYSATGAVEDAIRDRAFTAIGLGTYATRWFAFGYLEWTAGANTGRPAEVMLHEKASDVVTITLLEAPVRPISGGDGFTIRAGCDKRSATCAAKFANILNFRGFPHIPGRTR